MNFPIKCDRRLSEVLVLNKYRTLPLGSEGQALSDWISLNTKDIINDPAPASGIFLSIPEISGFSNFSKAGNKMRVVVIGNGKVALDCLKIISDTEILDVRLVVVNTEESPNSTKIERFCDDKNIKFVDTNNINSDHMLELFRNASPGYIFNINSYLIIKENLLAVPTNGIINFHNGPLPRYRGLNVCSWAIFNGETEYGVTWHFVSPSIDAGDIVANTSFPLRPDETALSLITSSASHRTDARRFTAPATMCLLWGCFHLVHQWTRLTG